MERTKGEAVTEENTQQIKPDAIIFLPGLGDAVEQDPENIARRIANALDRRAATGSAKFTVKAGGRGSEYTANPNVKEKQQPYTILPMSH
jgi:hypothetical protein